MKYLIILFVGIFSSIHATKASPHPEYGVVDVYKNGQSLSLDDGSLWSIGSWWINIATEWKTEEKIRLFYHKDSSIESVKISNIDRKESVWGEKIHSPEPVYSNCLSIKQVDLYRSLVTLSNGAVFKFFSKNLINKEEWCSGNLISILHGKSTIHKYPYGIWNHTTGSIVLGFQLIEHPLTERE